MTSLMHALNLTSDLQAVVILCPFGSVRRCRAAVIPLRGVSTSTYEQFQVSM
jgi:hypothetical protein